MIGISTKTAMIATIPITRATRNPQCICNPQGHAHSASKLRSVEGRSNSYHRRGGRRGLQDRNSSPSAEYASNQLSFEVRLNWLASANAPGAHSEVTSCFAHSAARSLIRSNLSVAGLPFRTIVALLRSSRGKTIALATAEPNFIAP